MSELHYCHICGLLAILAIRPLCWLRVDGQKTRRPTGRTLAGDLDLVGLCAATQALPEDCVSCVAAAPAFSPLLVCGERENDLATAAARRNGSRKVRTEKCGFVVVVVVVLAVVVFVVAGGVS